jgi:hypothetical protein
MLNADIAAPGRMQLPQQMLVAREEEYVFQPPPPLVVSGSVVDAETGEPIKSFRVIWGIRSTTDHMNWVRDRPIEGRDGQYVMRQSYGYPAHLVRIEADGYLPAVSREIESDEGDVRIDFKLEKGQNVAATVLTPSGAPAAGAKIALGVAGSQISVENGEIDDGSTYAARLEADEAGRFSFPPQEGPFQIVVTHPTGFAHLNSADGPIAETISLTAWARLEGTFRVGAEPVANAPITLNIETVHSYGPDVPSIFTHHDVTTGPDGRFVFERAFPGEGRVGRSMLLMVDEGATEVTSSRRDTVVLAAGQTSVIELGGVGRPVMGKLAPPERHQGKVLWNFALVHVQADVPPAPDVPPDLPDAAELEREWREALNELRAASPYFSVSVDRDGSFRVEDVPAGIYKLSVRFQQDAPGQLANYEFSVPVMESGRSDQPLDLGVLTLQ